LRHKQSYSDNLINKALYELKKVADDQSKSLYDINKAVYSLLRYGVKVREEVGENTQTVWLINWENPLENDFAIAEEVTVKGENTKRPDVVLYVNGIALGVLELKRSIVSVSEGIRQNLDNQTSRFIKPSLPPCSLLWQAMTLKAYATARSQPPKNIISPGKKKTQTIILKQTLKKTNIYPV
jgi:type I restriction enzyme R subunit